MNLGADDYMAKPVEPASAERLRELVLTPCEAEELFWVAQDKTNPGIGTITGVQLTEVKKHLESVFRKLGVETRTAAALERLGPLG